MMYVCIQDVYIRMFDACIFMREKQLRAVIVSSKVLEYESSDGSRRRMGVATPGETLGTL